MTTQTELLAEKITELLNLAEHLRDTRQLADAGMDTDLATVQLLRMIEQTATSANRTAVHEARERRATWAEVATALGMTAQGAQQRFSHR